MRRRNVLRRQKDFDALYKGGRSKGSRHVIIFYRKNDLGYSRVSFLASKKVGNSVTRNRARRLMKEGFRTLGPAVPEGTDLVIIARKGIEKAKMCDVRQSIKTALKNAGAM